MFPTLHVSHLILGTHSLRSALSAGYQVLAGDATARGTNVSWVEVEVHGGDPQNAMGGMWGEDHFGILNKGN